METTRNIGFCNGGYLHNKVAKSKTRFVSTNNKSIECTDIRPTAKDGYILYEFIPDSSLSQQVEGERLNGLWQLSAFHYEKPFITTYTPEFLAAAATAK